MSNQQQTAVEKLIIMQRSLTDSVYKTMDTFLQKYPAIDEAVKKLEETSGVNRRYILLGFIFVPLLFVAVPILLNVAAIAYPLFMSVKAIDKSKDDRTRWLIYWLLFNIIAIFDSLFGFFLHMLPAFTIIKFSYLVWCMAPIEKNGCYISYNILQPYLLQQVVVADQYLAGADIQQALRDGEGLIRETAIKATINGVAQNINNPQ